MIWVIRGACVLYLLWAMDCDSSPHDIELPSEG